MKTFEELKQDITTYIAEAKTTSWTRLDAIRAKLTASELTEDEARTQSASILSEKYSIEAVINQLKPVTTVQFNGETYQLENKTRVLPKTAHSTVIPRFAAGDIVVIKLNERTSIPYQVVQSPTGSRLVIQDEAGQILNPSDVLLQFRCETSGTTVDAFKADYRLNHNGNEFQGLAGLSHPAWHKV